MNDLNICPRLKTSRFKFPILAHIREICNHILRTMQRRKKCEFMICLEGDEPPIDAVMIRAKKTTRSFCFIFASFSVGFYGTQINGPLMQQRMETLKIFFLVCEQKKIIKAIIKREC